MLLTISVVHKKGLFVGSTSSFSTYNKAGVLKLL